MTKPLKRTLKTCKGCNIVFNAKANQQYHNRDCLIAFKNTTQSQYKLISGNWKKYFQRLTNQHHRNTLSTQDCLDLLVEQEGKCALSGVELTCQLEVGKKFLTNVSLDRIEAGGPYIKSNVQLVCTALNSWRGDTPIEEFIWWCKQVTKHQE